MWVYDMSKKNVLDDLTHLFPDYQYIAERKYNYNVFETIFRGFEICNKGLCISIFKTMSNI